MGEPGRRCHAATTGPAEELRQLGHGSAPRYGTSLMMVPYVTSLTEL